MSQHPLAGVYCAAITPLNADQSIALDDIPGYLGFLAERGCHGALLLGTTGEGPSFFMDERLAIFNAATRVRQQYPDFRLLAGTGTPNLEETVRLSKGAFDLGFDAVVVLPPYFYHQATEDGLVAWFQALIRRAVPQDGYLLGYHFPAQSGVPIPQGVVSQLRQIQPQRFAGVKDSTVNAEHAMAIGHELDNEIVALVGNDAMLSQALENGGSGCITAIANVNSPALRRVWDAYQKGEDAHSEQAGIDRVKEILGRYVPYPISMKLLLAEKFGFPRWAVRWPLKPFGPATIESLLKEFDRS
jgi:4-hydroxy-tetrahydrodipicolinate synthase